METAHQGRAGGRDARAAGVVNVGGEWYYDDYAPGRGVASLGVDNGAPTPPAGGDRRRADEPGAAAAPKSATASSTCSATERVQSAANSSGCPACRVASRDRLPKNSRRVLVSTQARPSCW